ncbi:MULTISPECIES: LXG domain-containing protein [Bacillus]|uniref:LXG domain-containing protein n=1 Tax=Bacillus TaxID=1386 RepID=UPI0002D6B8CE|nr:MULTISPECIES: LXG domain-containing protein [Bacillus]
MKVLEVNILQSGIDKVKNDLNIQEKQLQQIEQSIQGIIDLQDSFKGEGGQAIRGFYESYHLPFLKELLSFYGEYIETLSQMKLNLDLLEPNNKGFIRESFLEYEVSDGLKMIKERTMSLTEEANSIMSGVSDIVSLPKLDDSYVLQGITQADQKRDLTIGQLHTYDQQQTSALLPLENNVQAMVQYVQLVSTLFQARNGSVSSIESIFYSQDVFQPQLSLFTYSTATLNKLSAWDNFYLNYLKSNPNPKVEPLISAREAEALIHQERSSIKRLMKDKSLMNTRASTK